MRETHVREDTRLVNDMCHVAAAEYLGHRGTAAVADRLSASLRDAEPAVRRAAVEACGALLGELAVQSFYEPLADLLGDPVPQVAQAAIRASSRVAAPELIPRLRAGPRGLGAAT